MAEVGEGPALLRMSSLFRNDPVYQRFYRLWQDMNLGLAALFGDFLQMPLARTYELYELWCFLRLLRAAIEEYGATGVDLSSLFLGEAAWRRDDRGRRHHRPDRWRPRAVLPAAVP